MIKKMIDLRTAAFFAFASFLTIIAELSTVTSTNSWFLVYKEEAPEELR